MFNFTFNHINKNTSQLIDYNNCIYSSKESRPSKSNINCDNYKHYTKIDTTLNIFNIYSVDFNKKPFEYFILKEILIKLDNYSDLIESFSLSFDSIIINEINNTNFIFCFDKNLTLRKTVENLNSLINELEENDYLIINYIDLFTYTSVEFLIILSKLFFKVKVFYSIILKQNIVICIKYKHCANTIVFLKNLLKKWNKTIYIRQFGIFIPEEFQYVIKKYNDYIFIYFININLNINKIFNEKELNFKIYLKKIGILKSSNCIDCNHKLIENNSNKCYVCTKCYELFNIH